MDKFDLVIKNGKVFTSGDEYSADIGIRDGKIAAIAETLENGEKIIDAAGKWIFPGAIDIHTHLDAPLHGSHTLDDWYQGTYTAAFGGVTCVIDYPNQVVGETVRQTIERISANADGKAVVDYSFSPVLTDRTGAPGISHALCCVDHLCS